MKKLTCIVFCILLTVNFSIAQTNTFPSTGNTGIGTLSPGSALSIYGGGNGVTIGAVNGAAGFALNREVNTGAIINTNQKGFQFTQQGSGFEVQEYNPSGSFVGRTILNDGNFGVTGTSGTTGSSRFWVNGGTALGGGYQSIVAPTNGLLVQGYVGIGTTNPQAMLSVNGDVFAKKIKITQTGWSDYVFDNGYILPSLKEVEDFIKQHHHLQDIPSAKKVEADGIDVGDNQALLLKKIEELTLYMIDLNKKVDKLTEENELLKKEIKHTNQ